MGCRVCLAAALIVGALAAEAQQAAGEPRTAGSEVTTAASARAPAPPPPITWFGGNPSCRSRSSG